MWLYLFPYCIVYSILYLSPVEKEKKRFLWDIFTRLMSTMNSFLCLLMVFSEILNIIPMFKLEYKSTDSNNYYLYLFVYYLVTDGIFDILYNWLEDFKNFKRSDILGVIHHFIGAYGIYLIASTRLGFFLGFYFSFTELSTPLLNLSWVIRSDKMFAYFSASFFLCRILSIPLLLQYLNVNSDSLNKLTFIQYTMSYYASYTLIILNTVWFSYICKKIFPFLSQRFPILIQ